MWNKIIQFFNDDPIEVKALYSLAQHKEYCPMCREFSVMKESMKCLICNRDFND